MKKENNIIGFRKAKSKINLPQGDLYYCRADRVVLAYIYYTRIKPDESTATQLMNAVRNQEPNCIVMLGENLYDKVRAMCFEKLMTTLFKEESNIME